MSSRLDEERGLGLIEIIITIALMSIVMSVAAGSAVHAMKIQRRQVAEIDAVSRARIAMESMTREVRAANPILVADPHTVTVQVTRLNTRKLTTYTLTGDRIDVATSIIDMATQTQTALPTRTLLRGITMNAGESLFTYTNATGSALPVPVADPRTIRSVTLTVRMAMREQTRTVRVSDTVLVRNSVAP